MRIIHFISSPAAGGAETYVRDLSILMRQKGNDVHIVFLQSAEQGGRDIEFERDFLNTLDSQSVSYSFIGKESRRKPWLGVMRLRKVLRSFKPDIVHCHLYYALLFVFFFFNFPVVYTHHSFNLGVPKFFYRFFDRRVKAYIAICSACKELLARSGRNVIQINNAVSRERLNVVGRESGEGAEYVTFIFVGSLRTPKNLSLMLRAFGLIADKNFRLILLGEGPQRKYLIELAKSLGIDKKVDFLGNASDVGGFLAASDVFLMSSAWEGLPISLIEATLTGLPVIVTNVGGCAEVVHQCANGFVVDDLSVESYAAALKKIVDDSELRKLFSRNALKFSSLYEIEEAVENHLEVYRAVASKQPIQ